MHNILARPYAQAAIVFSIESAHAFEQSVSIQAIVFFPSETILVSLTIPLGD